MTDSTKDINANIIYVNTETARFPVVTPSGEPLPVAVVETHANYQEPPMHRVELWSIQPGNEGLIRVVFIRTVPRRGESVEFELSENSKETRLFRIMDVVHTSEGLRLHGHIAKSVVTLSGN